MRRAVSERSIQVKEGSGRRYWVRSNPSPGTGNATGGAAKKKSKARFLEPYHLSEARRAEIIALLDTGGVGDVEGRGLFAAAIEYDIAAYRQSAPAQHQPKPTTPAPQPPASDPALEEERRLADLLHAFGESATALVQAMTALDPAARERLAVQLKQADAFKRDYTNDYLDVLCGELNRVAEAARSIPRPVAIPIAAAPHASPRPPLSDGARRFLRRVARVYEECLDAGSAADATFPGVLDLVAAEAGIQPPQDTEVLLSILTGS